MSGRRGRDAQGGRVRTRQQATRPFGAFPAARVVFWGAMGRVRDQRLGGIDLGGAKPSGLACAQPALAGSLRSRFLSEVGRMTSRSASFPNERALVEAIAEDLASDRSPWPNLILAREFNYSRGRTDIVGVDEHGNVIAFEAKLSRWRLALCQAYRNTAFAHYSYVVLPPAAALRAARSIGDFARHSVGLCSASPSGVEILIEAPYADPVLPGLTSLAASAPGSPH